MLNRTHHDVQVGRRAWSGNDNAQYQIQQAMQAEPLLQVTLPQKVDSSILDAAMS
jgi:urocanate hydratase